MFILEEGFRCFDYSRFCFGDLEEWRLFVFFFAIEDYDIFFLLFSFAIMMMLE